MVKGTPRWANGGRPPDARARRDAADYARLPRRRRAALPAGPPLDDLGRADRATVFEPLPPRARAAARAPTRGCSTRAYGALKQRPQVEHRDRRDDVHASARCTPTGFLRWMRLPNGKPAAARLVRPQPVLGALPGPLAGHLLTRAARLHRPRHAPRPRSGATYAEIAAGRSCGCRSSPCSSDHGQLARFSFFVTPRRAGALADAPRIGSRARTPMVRRHRLVQPAWTAARRSPLRSGLLDERRRAEAVLRRVSAGALSVARAASPSARPIAARSKSRARRRRARRRPAARGARRRRAAPGTRSASASGSSGGDDEPGAVALDERGRLAAGGEHDRAGRRRGTRAAWSAARRRTSAGRAAARRRRRRRA